MKLFKKVLFIVAIFLLIGCASTHFEYTINGKSVIGTVVEK